MSQYLIVVDVGLAGDCYYELRATPEGRDECIRQVSMVRPDFRIACRELPSVALPEDGSPVTIALTMQQVAPMRDPGRGL